MTDSIIIEARNAVKQFGQGDHAVRALDDVSIKIRKGEFFTLLGPSGCGKTTLLRLIAGFEMPSSGQILLDGVDVSDLPPNKRPVNTVFQSYALFPHLTVAENVGFGLEMQGRPMAEVRETAARMLALVKLESMANRKTSQLSGGQQQRVALARALAPKPKVLLLDEPLSALDLKLRKEMQIELKRLQTETGITFIFVTHDQEEALTMSDRIAVMSTGRLQQVGTPQDIYKTPVNRFVASFIGESNFLPATCTKDGVVLDCGARIDGVRTGMGSGKVTVTIRPEHLHLAMAPVPGCLTAQVTNLVYMGTDMQCHASLPDGSPIMARISPDAAASGAAVIGGTISFRIDPASVQVLEDSA